MIPRRVVEVFIGLAVALTFVFVLIIVSGASPYRSFAALFTGAFGNGPALAETFLKAIPLAISGLAVALGLRTGLFNIGVEGQLLVGALAGAAVGFSISAPAVIHVLLCLSVGAVAGAMWAFFPAYLRAKRGVHEVITTIMLNYIAFHFTHYLVSGPLKDVGTMAPQTPEIKPSAVLGLIPHAGGVHWGILVAGICTIGFGFLLWRTALGFELRAVGLNPDAARTAGIDLPRAIIIAMLISGALAGIAGTVEVLGVHHKFYDQFSPGYGFDSIAVALLGGNTAIGNAAAALLFGALRNGAIHMQLVTEIPREIVVLIQAIVIVFAGTRFMKMRHEGYVNVSERHDE